MPLRRSLSSVSSLSLHFKSTTTFPFCQSEGVKISKIFWSLDTNRCGICEGCYISDLPRKLVISKYATHSKKCKTKYCVTKNFLGDVYIRPKMKSIWIEISSHLHQKFCLHNFIKAACFFFFQNTSWKYVKNKFNIPIRRNLMGANVRFLEIIDDAGFVNWICLIGSSHWYSLFLNFNSIKKEDLQF